MNTVTPSVPVELIAMSGAHELFSRTVGGSAPSPTSFLTPDRILLMNNMSSILAGISLIFCLVVLGFTALVATNAESRKCLDRVSFRLIVYALISNCIYCIGYIICVKVPPGFWCVAGVWMIQFWLGITNCLIMFIALNLQLVLVHLKNGIVLEKYYLIITVVLNLGTTIPPLAKGKFGWDPVIKVCWLTSNNDRDRLIWQFCTQLMWIILTVLVTIVSACITIFSIYKHKFTALKLLKSNLPTDTMRSGLGAVPRPTPKRRGSGYSVLRGATKSLLSNADFRNIILRISLYPAVMIILNVVITVADIRISTSNGIYDPYSYGLYVVYYALYGARGMFYALIAVVDPALIRGFKVWRGVNGFSSASTDNMTADGALVEASADASTVEAKQRAQFGGISVRTQITTQVDNEEVDPLDSSALPMSQIRRHAGPTTTVVGSALGTQQGVAVPPAAYVSDHEELDGLDALPSTIPGNRLSKDLSKVQVQTRWAGEASSMSELSVDDDMDDSSTAELAYVDAYGNVQTSGNGYVDGIRQRQRQRSLQRREVEKSMKRRI